MNQSAFRYEYRAFARNFGLVEDRLRQWGESPLIRESSEFYLLAAGRPDQNIKIRSGQLDIKDRVAIEHGFEQWRPVGKWDFPLDETGRTALASALGLAQPIDADPAGDAEALIQGLCSNGRQVVKVDLFKRRFGFEIDGCMAEYAEVTVNDAALATVCVESADLNAAQDLCQRLGLDQYPNTGYIAALMRVVAL
jgi:hypothetical protein